MMIVFLDRQLGIGPEITSREPACFICIMPGSYRTPVARRFRCPEKSINYVKLWRQTRYFGEEENVNFSTLKKSPFPKMKQRYEINEIQWSIRDFFCATPPYCYFLHDPLIFSIVAPFSQSEIRLSILVCNVCQIKGG